MRDCHGSSNLVLHFTVVTGVLNAIFVYVIAYHVQQWIANCFTKNRSREGTVTDPRAELESGYRRYTQHAKPNVTQPGLSTRRIAVSDPSAKKGCAEAEKDVEPKSLDRFRKHLSDVSTLCTWSGYTSDTSASPLYVCNGRERIKAYGKSEGNAQTYLDPESMSTSQVSQASLQSCTRLHRCVAGGWAWSQQNIFLTLSILLFLGGIPLSAVQQNDLLLDTGFLLTVWLTFTTAQTTLKQNIICCDLQQQQTRMHITRRLLRFLTTALNPVLWTSLFLLCYGLAKSRIQHESTALVVARFKTNNTLSDIIAHHITMPDIIGLEESAPSNQTSSPSSASLVYASSLPIGAGDIATSVLNAGIVAWGFKLFEYRNQIFSRCGLTVLVTSALAALFNVIVWPLLAHRIGVRPAPSDLSFAARSVTIALGVPAMKSLGGDTGVNAVGVVVNGICFQLVAGCFVGGEGFEALMSRRCRAIEGWIAGTPAARFLSTKSHTLPHHPITQQQVDREATIHSSGLFDTATARSSREHQDPVPSSSNEGVSGDEPPAVVDADSTENAPSGSSDSSSGSRRCGTNGHDPEAAAQTAKAPPSPNNDSNNRNLHNDPSRGNDTRAVAAGVTIGINAAAMGTVHLYELNSPAAPYSALAMTMFGVFTVLFTVRSPMVEWLVGMVGG